MLNTIKQHIEAFSAVLANKGTHSSINITEAISQSSSSKISPEMAIDIYKNNTHGSRVNTLKIIYPVCNKIVGDDVFSSIAQDYVLLQSTGTSDLNQYGKDFNQHFEQLLNAHRLSDDYKYLPDLAQLEFFMHAAYYADADPVFNFELFQKRIEQNDTIYLKVSESLALVASQYPVYQIWSNHKSEKNNHCHEVEELAGTQFILIHRDQYKPTVTCVKECEYNLILAFTNRQSLDAVIGHEECGVDQLLPEMIEKKWVVDVE